MALAKGYAEYPNFPTEGIDIGIRGIALQADGKIVTVGTDTNYSYPSARLRLARYDADGELDGSFAQIGNCCDAHTYGQALAVQGDGKFVVAGQCAYTGVLCLARFMGDAQDADGDGVTDDIDNCVNVGNTTQADADSDGVGTACDNCPNTANAGQENADGDRWGDACEYAPCVNVATVWVTPDGDDDCDGWTTALETVIGTDPEDQCGFMAGGVTPSEVWPPDLVPSNSVTISDVLALKPFFGTTVPPTSARFDLAPGGGIGISDVLALKPYFGKPCTP